MAAQAAEISDIIDRRPLGRYQLGIVSLCAALAFVEGFGAQNAGYIAPALVRVFRLRPTQLGSYFSIGLFGLMLGALFVAPLADRVGRKPVLIGCASLFGLCSLAQSVSP